MAGTHLGYMETVADHVGGVDSIQAERATYGGRQQGVRSSEAPFMATSGRDRRGGIVGVWSVFVLITWLFALCRV